jgi:hypothetical protein
MMIPYAKVVAVAWVACLLAGCYTPQPVRDLASKGAGSASMAEAELQRYLSAAQDSLSARLVVTRQLSEAELEESYTDTFTRFLQERTGQQTGDEVLTIIRSVGQEHRRVRQEKDAAFAKLAETHKKALADAVRSPTQAFDASKKSFAVLAQELTPQEWLKLSALYAKTIHDTLKQIKEDEKKAKAKAAEDKLKK